MLHALRHTLGQIFNRRSSERILQNELEFHHEQLTKEKVAAGMDPEAARRSARLEIGGAEQLKEQVRDEWGTQWLDNLRNDLRFAIRNLVNNRAYTALAVLTLGLGIGCNTALFSVIHAAVLKPLPFAEDARLVQLRSFDQQAKRPDIGFSVKDMDDLRAGSQTLAGLVEIHVMPFIMLGGAESEAVQTGVVSGEYFEYLGVKPKYGRLFAATDEREGADAVLLLNHRYFQSSFGGDPNVVGKTVRMNDRVHTIIGVLPPLPEYPAAVDVYMPTTSCPTRSSKSFRENRRARMMTAFARLKPGVSATQAQEEVKAITRRMRSNDPNSYPKHEEWGVQVLPLKDEMSKQAKPAFSMLFAATALVVLIACANIANLTIARMMQRHRELAIRSSLGATRGRLTQQLAVEGLLVGGAACVFALLLAYQTLKLLAPFAQRFSSRAAEISVDQTVLLFCIAVTLITALLAYLLPAQPALRNLISATREGSQGSTASSSQTRARGFLVAAQVALSFLLLTGAGLLFRSFLELVNTEAGVQAERVISMKISPNWTKIDSTAKFRGLIENLVDRVRNSPGVVSAGIGSKVPLNERLPFMRNMVIEGQVLAPDAPRPVIDVAIVGPGYIETLRVPLLNGRLFTSSDGPESQKVAMLNRTAAKHFWPDSEPVGRRISFDGGDNWMTIVGVLSDVRQYGLDREVTDEVYLPFAQSPGGTSVVIRTATDPGSMTYQLRHLVHEIDPDHAVSAMRTLDEIRSESIAPQRMMTTLLGLFSLLTLAIMIAGVGGVAALSVAQRKAEIGIRVACGARPGQIISMVLQQHLRLIVGGVLVGIAGSLALGQLMSTFLYRTQPSDLITLIGACLLILTVSTLACFMPARRAAKIDPLLCLRTE
jgi:putative ABC transport system permease protein